MSMAWLKYMAIIFPRAFKPCCFYNAYKFTLFVQWSCNIIHTALATEVCCIIIQNIKI